MRSRSRWIAVTFTACLTLACHSPQNFPRPALSTRSPSPGLELFEPKLSGLDDQPTFTDLSTLNSDAAGTHGFVHAERGHFVDDRRTRLRFFGVNLSGPAALPDRATGARLARHFRKLGFNAVRLRGLDAPGSLLADDGEPRPEALRRLDDFCAELKAQGIYFSLGLHALGGYAGLEGEALAHFPQGKILDRFHVPFLDAQRRLARALLGHLNPRTGHPYNDEPSLLYLELSNEDSLFPARTGSPDDLPPSYRAELAQGYAAWLAEQTARGLRAPGPADEEAKGGLPSFHGSASASADYARYLHETELNAVSQLATFVRAELGLRSMLVNSQVSFGGLSGVLREASVSDFVDMHGYWDPPRSNDSGSLATWSIQNVPQVRAPDAGALGVMASYRVYGKPFVASEYAVAAPSDFAVETFPLLVGIAGLQDWDALFAFAYATRTSAYEPERINGVFDLAGHPAKLAFVTMAASAFRRGLIAPGRGRLKLDVPANPSRLPFDEDALPSLWTERGIATSAAALQQVGIALQPGSGEIHASDALQVPAVLGSDTGELLWEHDGDHPRFSIDAPSLELVCGLVAKSSLRFRSATFEFGDFFGGYACASLFALDEQPIASSHRLLLTVAARAQNAHFAEHGSPLSFADLGAGPALAQYVPFSLELPSSAWRARALDSAGASLHSVPVVAAIGEGESRIATDPKQAALSYAIER